MQPIIFCFKRYWSLLSSFDSSAKSPWSYCQVIALQWRMISLWSSGCFSSIRFSILWYKSAAFREVLRFLYNLEYWILFSNALIVHAQVRHWLSLYLVSFVSYAFFSFAWHAPVAIITLLKAIYYYEIAISIACIKGLLRHFATTKGFISSVQIGQNWLIVFIASKCWLR